MLLGGHNVLSTSSSLPFLLRLWLLRRDKSQELRYRELGVSAEIKVSHE